MTGLSPIEAALRRRCPKCGEGRLLTGFLEAAPTCSCCGLDLTRFEAGDGPAFIAGALAGVAGIGSVALMMLAFDAGPATTIAVAVCATLIVSIGSLPFLKAFFIAQAWTKTGRD